MAAIAAGAGALLAWLTWRVAPMRQFLPRSRRPRSSCPSCFLPDAEISGSLTPSSSSVRTPPLASTPPIVLIVFDEFPLHSLLDADGRIDQVRFPHFAALARDASWFRETTSVSSQTVWAVPAIVSGGYPVTPKAVPTLRYYPQNLFTLLADRYEMFVFGRFLQLCPEDRCHRDVEGPGDGPLELLADLGVVWLHIVVAGAVDRTAAAGGRRLAGVCSSGGNGARGADGSVRIQPPQLSSIASWPMMDARPARLYFLHSLLPHMPFEFVPSERRYDAPDYQGRDENGAGLFQRVGARLRRRAAPAASVAGRLRRLAGGPTWSARLARTGHLRSGPGDRDRRPRRELSRVACRGAAISLRNLADIVRVPLFVKRPAQRDGAVVDGIVESVDVLPTIADMLGMRLPFPVDGRSFVGDDEARTSRDLQRPAACSRITQP